MLLGYYRIPATADKPLDVVINPLGLEVRSQVRSPTLLNVTAAALFNMTFLRPLGGVGNLAVWLGSLPTP